MRKPIRLYWASFLTFLLLGLMPLSMDAQSQLPAAYSKSNSTLNTERTDGMGAITVGFNPHAFNIPQTSTAYAPEGAEQSLVFDNGPYFNVTGTPNLSLLESVTLNMNTFGANISAPTFAIADDFELLEETEITSIDVYSYQTGASSTSINEVYMQIWDGDPSASGSTVVWGNLTDNVFGSVENTGVYRVSETAQSDRTRFIQKVTVNITGLTLDAGTYYLEYSLAGTVNSGPWQPPIAILGEDTTGDALQRTSTGWQAWVDSGTNTPQGVPFQIYGNENSGPFPAPYCEVTGNSSVEPISRVVFADIDNSSDPNGTEPHEDFTHITGHVEAGETYGFAGEGNTAGAFTNYFTVWIDWNRDGVFDEDTERYNIGTIFNSTGTDGQQATADIDVPADAVPGRTRMRVMKRFSAYPNNSCTSGSTYGQTEDYSIEVSGGGTSGGGETCGDPLVVTDLPYDHAGNTADYGNSYSNGDVPPEAPGAVTTGTGSEYYLSGPEVVYSYTPSEDEVLNITTTNDDGWVGLWAFTGCPFTSTVGYHTSTSGTTRAINGLEVTANETYYFVVSSWESQKPSTDYTIHIEKVGGVTDPGECEISTLYAGGNNGSAGGAVYFDVTVAGRDLEITDLDMNIGNSGVPFTVEVYTLEGTYAGNETDQSLWTLQAEGSGTSAGTGSPSRAVLDTPVELSANTTYGFALVLTTDHSHYYTNGDGTNEHYENGDLELDLGSATNVPFSGNPFSPRIFNGGLYYNVDGGCGGVGGNACEQVFFDSDQTTGVGFSNGLMVANDVTVAAGETFTMQTMTFDVVNLGGLPTEYTLEIFEDNGTGGVGASTGMMYQFDSSNMTYEENGTFAGYTQYTITLDLPDIEISASASEDARYWLSIASELSSTGDFTYWVSYDYSSNPDSYPTWQFTTDVGHWFEYEDSSGLRKEGIMSVSGECDTTIGIDNQTETVFSYYPNPASEVVTITANKDISSVSVYNILGQQVLSASRPANGQVSVAELTAGTYIFRASFEDGSVETFKIIKR